MGVIPIQAVFQNMQSLGRSAPTKHGIKTAAWGLHIRMPLDIMAKSLW